MRQRCLLAILLISATLFSQAQKKRTLDMLQGTWASEKDKDATVKISKELWTFNYTGEPASVNDSLWIDINNKQLILANKKDTLRYEITALSQKTLSLKFLPAGKVHVYTRRSN